MRPLARKDREWIQELLPELAYRSQLWEGVWRSKLLNQLFYFSLH